MVSRSCLRLNKLENLEIMDWLCLDISCVWGIDDGWVVCSELVKNWSGINIGNRVNIAVVTSDFL